MIKFVKFELKNGLRVLVHEDKSTPMVAVNVLYDVGAKDELPEKTGFAHLFEHLMFGGTVAAPNFDEPLQNAGGDCNAFTNSDLTNFYDILPAENLEIALWLESDRMKSLKINQKSLSTQQKVVVEEFKETCLNEPYGDVWHHLNGMAYQVHPYKWPTIGSVPKHVEDANLEDVKHFYSKFYAPNNAILVIAGNVELEQTKALVEKWFGHIPAGAPTHRNLSQEPEQTAFRQLTKFGKVPMDAIYMAFHMPARDDQNYYTIDLLSDVLSNGQSSRLYRRLLKEQQLVSVIDCYITGNIDPGLLIIEAKPAEGKQLEEVEAAILKEIEILKTELLDERELQKIKNKVESNLVFSEMNVLNKAINLAFYELIGDIDLINTEGERYQQVTAEGIREAARKILTRENCSVLYYKMARVQDK